MPEILPGDVLDYGDRLRRVVASLTTKQVWKPAACKCCSEPHIVDVVWVFGEEPIEVITKGGGTAHVIPVQETWPGWERVLRNGKEVTP